MINSNALHSEKTIDNVKNAIKSILKFLFFYYLI